MFLFDFFPFIFHSPSKISPNPNTPKTNKLSLKAKTLQSTPPFCDRMPKGKQDIHHQKEGGLNYANSARKTDRKSVV